MMRRLLKAAAALMLMVSAIACKKDGGDPAMVDMSGEWKLSTLNGTGTDSMFGGEGLDIYLYFGSDGSFETFERLQDSEMYAHYSGTYSISGYTASGTYSDGTSWGASYTVSLSEDGATLTMTAGSEECVYAKTAIPSEVRDNISHRAALKSTENAEAYPGKFL